MPEYNPLAYRQAGYDYVDNALSGSARRRAGAQYGTPEAATTLARAGLIDEASALQRQDASIAAAETARAQEEQDTEGRWLLRAAQSLAGLPYEERQAVYTSQVRPLLQQNGFDDEELARIDAADLNDNELNAVITTMGGTVASPYANDRAGRDGAVVRPDRYTGAYTEVYTPPVDPMDDLDRRYREAQIRATEAQVGQREAQADRARRPAASRGGGSRSSGGSRPAASAPTSGSPWENYR